MLASSHCIEGQELLFSFYEEICMLCDSDYKSLNQSVLWPCFLRF